MIEKLKRKLKENKYFVFAAVLGITALGAYFSFKPKPPKGKDNKQVSKRELSMDNSTKDVQDLESLESREEKALVRVINRLKKLLMEEGFSYEAVKEIYKSQFELSQQEFKTIVLANRRERRSLLGNIVEYQKKFLKYETQIEEIHNKHLNAVLAHFRIDKAGWIQLTEAVSAQHQQQWNQLLISTEEEELLPLRDTNKPKIKLSALIDIQKYRYKLLKQKMEEFKKTFMLLQKSDLYNLVQKWGVDNIYAKFSVEQQDIIYSKQHLSEEEKQTLYTYEEEVQNLMGELICDDQYSQSLQNSNSREGDEMIS